MFDSDNPPEFRPNRDAKGKPQFEIGQTVRFVRQNGKSHVGRIQSKTMGGNYEIVDDGGNQFMKSATELEPAGTSASSGPIHSAESIAAHLRAGGEAYYTPSMEQYGPDAGKLDFTDRSKPHEPIPLHTTWMGEASNLNEYVNFDDIAAGKARIDLAASTPAPKRPRPANPLDRLSDIEYSTFIRTGASKAFDDVPAEERSRKHGGHSLDELLSDRKLATKDRVSAWIGSMRQSQGEKKDNSDTASKALDAGQTILDGVGVGGDAVIPGAGVAADGTNTVVSLIRAATDKKNSGEHLKNAAISAVSMVPFVGDLAKVLKYTRKRGGDGGGDGGNDPPDSLVGSAGGDGGNGGDPLESRSASTRDKVLGFAGAIGKGTAATIAAAESMSLLNKSAIEYNRGLVKYSGMIAESYGKLEADRAMRSVRQGRDLSGSLSGMIESQSNLEDKLQDFESGWKVMGGDMMKIFTDILAVVVQILDYVEIISDIYVKYIRPWLDKFGLVDSGVKESNTTGWMDRIRKEAAERAKQPRKV